MQKRFFLVSLAVCCAIALSGSVALGAENWLGTWKMDASKSKFTPGPGPKSQTLKFVSGKDGVTLSSESVDAAGKAMTGGYTSKWDGKDVPYVGNPNADTSSAKKVDDNNYVNTWKLAGKPTVEAKVVVSADGKTLTVTQVGKSAKGEALDNTVVYTRQ